MHAVCAEDKGTSLRRCPAYDFELAKPDVADFDLRDCHWRRLFWHIYVHPICVKMPSTIFAR